MNFMENMKETLNEEFNESVTENGAVGYRTTGQAMLDFNYKVASYRSKSEEEIIKDFEKVWLDNKVLAMQFLFFIRDREEGLGERKLFRVIIKHLANIEPDMVKKVISITPEYGRWDDLLELFDTSVEEYVIELFCNQIEEDVENCTKNKPISLLAKWLPSLNQKTTHEKTIRKRIKDIEEIIKRAAILQIPKAEIEEKKKELNKLKDELNEVRERDCNIKAKKIIKYDKATARDYRKLLSVLRKYIDVTERKMCANEWDKIKYENVPSRANLNYNDAFLRHDEERRREFLGKVERGEKKINAGKLYPHDIVHKYEDKVLDQTLEELWKALPQKEIDNTLVVADGSGSMTSTIGSTGVTALDVANALAIYFAEHNKGQFKDKYITFSENPQYVDFEGCTSLHDKIRKALAYDEVADTNIEKVFDLILETAIKHNLPQEEMPANILIISDMEFNNCVCYGEKNWSNPNKKLFQVISKRYVNAGYKLPRLVFWNVNSRTCTIPVKENDLGVALVSGFSTNIAEMVMSNEIDPLKVLLEKLGTERYKKIAEKLAVPLDEC